MRKWTILLLWITLGGQSMHPTPEQARTWWADFEQRDPVTAKEIELFSNHPDLTFKELDALVKAVVQRERLGCKN